MKKLYHTMRKHPICTSFIIFALYFLLACIANWSLVTSDNFMKWDIFDAHYPASTYLSDCIQAGTLPVWNPIFQFGTPYYAIVGMPIWYPTTVLGAMLGYTPTMMNMEYVVHIAIACFGMFLLSRDFLSDSKYATLKKITLAFIAGLLYGFSTVFLSNAQHIMIFISAAWIPYVLYYSKIFITKKKPYAIMLAGLFIGVMILGGYPELWVALFLILIPYFLYFNYQNNKSLWKNILSSAGKYMLLAVLGVLAGFITILPFVNSMDYIARFTSDLGQTPESYPLQLLLSMFIPGISNVFRESYGSLIDITMMDFYIGIITFATIPLIIFYKNKHKGFCITILVFSFLMNAGRYSFLHSIFYKFFPIFDTLRFPSLWRCIFAIFILLLSVGIWQDLLRKKNVTMRQSMIKIIKIYTIILFSLGFLCAILAYMSPTNFDVVRCNEFARMVLTSAVLMLLFLIVFCALNQNYKALKRGAALMLVAVVIETFSFHYIETPLLIGNLEPTAASQQQTDVDWVNSIILSAKNRDRDINLANQPRSNSYLNSQSIVYNKTIDEEGYISFLLSSTQNYKQTYNCKIIEQNPAIYFTSDIVSSNEVDYQEWAQDCGINPSQIYVNQASFSSYLDDSIGLPKTVETQNISFVDRDNTYYLEYNFNDNPSTTGFRKLSVYLEDVSIDQLDVGIVFSTTDDQNRQQKIEKQGNFTVHSDNKGAYIDVYYPDHTSYTNMELSFDQAVKIKQCDYIFAERLREANHVNTTIFAPNTIITSVDAQENGYLTVLQNYYPGWEAYVDGEKVAIKKVNETFMGVYLDKGEHEVSFKFKPKDFIVGLIVTIIYNIVLILVSIYAFIRTKRTHSYRRRKVHLTPVKKDSEDSNAN